MRSGGDPDRYSHGNGNGTQTSGAAVRCGKGAAGEQAVRGLRGSEHFRVFGQAQKRRK